MNLFKRFSCVVFLLALFPLYSVETLAQTDSPATDPVQRQADSHKDPPPDEVELLKVKVDQLEKLVEQQQRLLTAMEKRLSTVEEKTASPTEKKTVQLREAKLTDAQPAMVKTTDSAASPASQPTTQTSEAKPFAGWNKDHAFVQSADGNFTANIIGFVHFDYRGYQSGDHPPDTFLVRRARLGLEGKLAKYFEYKVLGDFADPRTPLRDAFVTIHKINELQFRFGQFKEPFGQEEITPVTNVDFVERSMVDNLVPSRSPGMMVFGVINKGVFEYYLGAFNGKGLLATNNNNTPEGVVRLRIAPFKNQTGSVFKNFAFGGAYAQGRNQNGLSITGGTESRSFTFYTPEIVNGKITRANGEFSWTISQAQVRAEYDQVNQEREGLGFDGATLPGIVSKGFVSQFTYLLTGEHKPEASAFDPIHPLFGDGSGAPGFGAWELKARFARLQIADGTAKSNHAETIYFGANWYMNRFIKYMLDFGIERFNDPLRSPSPKDKNYFVTLSRIQFTF
jgi:phosphate-selective porin OprO/OprP